MKANTPFLKLLAPLTILVLAATPAWAATRDAEEDVRPLTINITGKVVATGTCLFVDSEQNINFGNVQFSSTLKPSSNVLFGTYRKALKSSMNCSGDTAGSAQMKLEPSDGQSFTYEGTKVIQTAIDTNPAAENSGLYVQLLLDGNPQDVGEWFNVSTLDLPKLEVELVHMPGSNDVWVSGSNISASATLVMAFN